MPFKYRVARSKRHRGPLDFTEYRVYDGKAQEWHGFLRNTSKNVLQRIYSEGHPYRQLGKKGENRDIGGPFQSQKAEVVLGEGCGLWDAMLNLPTECRWHVFLVPHTYVGTIIDDTSRNRGGFLDADNTVVAKLTEFGVPALESVSNLNSWGTSVISSIEPTSPVADLAVSLGEFVSERKFFNLPGTSGSLPGEYLNYMFGISPTVDLVKDLRKAISDSETLLRQYSRDSGRLVRRQYEPEPETATTRTVFAGVKPSSIGTGLPSQLTASGTLTLVTRTTTQWKFAGAFTYYLPKEGWFRTVQELDYLYGVKPGASLAWELLPYSWLVDYKLNIGDVLHNVDAFVSDGLVMPYAYVLKETKVTKEYVWQGSIRGPQGTMVNRTVAADVVLTTQQRLPATPFGFGIDPGSLSLRQLSIIAALGLSRV